MTATEPGRYIARPVVTEAIQWDGSEECLGAIARWAEDALVTVSVEGQLCVDSPEGAMLARPGDWIIRGVPGEYYPREPDTFDSAYRPAPQGSAAGPTDPEDGNPPTTDRMQALAAFQVAVAACTLGLDGDALAAVLSQALQAAETAASSQRSLRG